MIHLVGYLQVYKPPRFFGPFLKTGVIFANLSGAGKMQISIMLLKFWYIKMEEISAFSLIMFVETSFSCEALETYKSFIFFMTCSFVILLKVKTEILFLLLSKYWGGCDISVLLLKWDFSHSQNSNHYDFLSNI